MNELQERGPTIESLTESFDLVSKEGQFMFAVLAAATVGDVGEEDLAATRKRVAGCVGKVTVGWVIC